LAGAIANARVSPAMKSKQFKADRDNTLKRALHGTAG